MKILKKIRKFFRIQYRLSVFTDGRYTNTYGTKKGILLAMAKHATPLNSTWTLYKSGPFGLSERMLEYGVVNQYTIKK